MKVINLISGPRNLSTALMYSFAQRADLKVIDEPFYAYYLKNTNTEAAHPEASVILKSLPVQKEGVLKMLKELQNKTQKNIFIKGMAHHYLEDEPTFILNWQNIILIRHPKKLLASFSKVIKNPTIEDIGIKKAAQLFQFLKAKGKTPLVIDSDELLKNPEHYLHQICLKLGIPFSPKMLKWSKGGIDEDGVWAPHWYKNVHNSKGFVVQKSSSQPMPSHLQPVLDEAIIHYTTLQHQILKNK